VLQGADLGFDGGDLGCGELGNLGEFAGERGDGVGGLLFGSESAAGSGGRGVLLRDGGAVGAIHASEEALGNFLAVDEGDADVALAGDDVADAEDAVHAGVARNFFAGEGVILAVHVEAGKFFGHGADRRDDKRGAEFVFGAGDGRGFAAFDFGFDDLEADEAAIFDDDAGGEAAVLHAEKIFALREAQHFLADLLGFGDLFGSGVIGRLRERHVLFAAAID